jgi:cell division septation protein DedD
MMSIKMKKNIKLMFFAQIVMFFGAVASAEALGLGEIKIISQKGEQFAAVIPIMADEKEAKYFVRAGNLSDYYLVQTQRPKFIETFKFRIGDDPARPKEKAVFITISKPIPQETFNLVIRVTSGTDSVLENYQISKNTGENAKPEKSSPATAAVVAPPPPPAPVPVVKEMPQLAITPQPSEPAKNSPPPAEGPPIVGSAKNPWVLQIATHKSRELAKKHFATLKGATVYESSSFTDDKLFIILAGRFETEEAAKPTKNKLIKMGESATMVVKFPFTIRLASFGNEEGAQDLMKKLIKDGHTPYVMKNADVGKTEYTVYLGGFKQLSSAKKVLGKLNYEGITPAIATP